MPCSVCFDDESASAEVFGFATAVADCSASFAAFSTWLVVVSLMMMVLRTEKVAIFRREGCENANVIIVLGGCLMKGTEKGSNGR